MKQPRTKKKEELVRKMRRKRVGSKMKYGKEIVARDIADDCMAGDAARRAEHESMVSSRAKITASRARDPRTVILRAAVESAGAPARRRAGLAEA